MIHDITYYKKIQNALDSTSLKQTALRNSIARINRDFKKTINWEMVTVSEQNMELLITPGSNATNKKIKTRPQERIYLGQIVSWANTYWLITELDFDQQICCIGEMEQCNTILRWQNEDHDICSAFAVAEDATKYGEGVQDTVYMHTPYFVLKLKVPINQDTSKIVRDKRFLLGKKGSADELTSYVVTRVNRITGTYDLEEQDPSNGYIEITLSEDQLRPDADNIELGIADYIAPEEDPPEEGGWF